MRADHGPFIEISIGSFRVEGTSTSVTQIHIHGRPLRNPRNHSARSIIVVSVLPEAFFWILEGPSIGPQQAPSAYAAKRYAHAW